MKYMFPNSRRPYAHKQILTRHPIMCLYWDIYIYYICYMLYIYICYIYIYIYICNKELKLILKRFDMNCTTLYFISLIHYSLLKLEFTLILYPTSSIQKCSELETFNKINESFSIFWLPGYYSNFLHNIINNSNENYKQFEIFDGVLIE